MTGAKKQGGEAGDERPEEERLDHHREPDHRSDCRRQVTVGEAERGRPRRPQEDADHAVEEGEDARRRNGAHDRRGECPDALRPSQHERQAEGDADHVGVDGSGPDVE